MRKEHYDLMYAQETDFWWFAGMRMVMGEILKKHLQNGPKRTLDVGCGTGINLLWMASFFRPESITGCDYSRAAIGWCAEALRSARDQDAIRAVQLSRGDARRLPFSEGSFDLVTSFDVLNHFPEGEAVHAMAEISRVLRPGGLAIIREPAYQWLLSNHDTIFGTCRRYSAPELERRMTRVGFRILETTYANTVLFPLAAAQRLLRKHAGIASDRTDVHPWPPMLRWLNGPFKACLGLESRLLARGCRLPFGLSAICVARKIDSWG